MFESTPITRAGTLLAVAASTIAATGGVARATTIPIHATVPNVLTMTGPTDYGHVLVGEQKTLTFHIVNTYTYAIRTPTVVVTPTGGGDAFAATSVTCDSGKAAVPANGACDAQVRFLPADHGAAAAAVHVVAEIDGDLGTATSPDVSIQGQGDAFRLEAAYDFGAQGLGTLEAPASL